MLSPKEKAALRESFRNMTPREKADYIFTYYKWYILLGLIALAVAGNFLWRQVTKKEPVVYLGMVNVTVGTDLEQAMTTDYLVAAGFNPRKNEVSVYTGMYLSEDASTENHEYAYASRLKVMASVNAQKLDVVLMNQEAYDLLSGSGYLLELAPLLGEDFPGLTENQVVLEDNSIEYTLNEADELHIVTEGAWNGVEITDSPLFRDAGFDGAVYVGIIANTPRPEETVRYLQYLAGVGLP